MERTRSECSVIPSLSESAGMSTAIPAGTTTDLRSGVGFSPIERGRFGPVEGQWWSAGSWTSISTR